MKEIILSTILLITPIFSQNGTEIVFPCTVTVAKRRVIHRIFTGYGKVKIYKKFKYRAPLSGKVTYFPFNNGDSVREGTLLIKITDSSAIYEYRGLVDEIKSMEEIAKTGILKSGYFSKKAKLAKLREKLRLAEFKSPFNGIITNVSVFQNQVVKEGEELFEIIYRDTFIVELKLNPVDAKKIRIGLPARIEFQSGEAIKSVVAAKEYSSSGLKFLLPVAYFPGIVPGEFVRVVIKKPIKSVLSVPTKSVVSGKDGKYHIFKVKNGLAKWVYITPGVKGDDFIEILKGNVSEGDTVVLDGNLFLGHNVKVKILKCID